MRLIDLLVQELPSRGGWPEGVNEIGQDYDGELMFYGRGNARTRIYLPLSSDHRDMCCHNGDKVTKDRYESALAASQNPAWNGDGVPPVGCECECQFLDAWHVCKVLFVGAEVIVGVIDGSERAFSVNHTKFRPLRTESERKHEDVLESICAVLEMVAQDYKHEDEAKLIYEAIAAGKIPGVKLED